MEFVRRIFHEKVFCFFLFHFFGFHGGLTLSLAAARPQCWFMDMCVWK